MTALDVTLLWIALVDSLIGIAVTALDWAINNPQ